MNHTRYVAALGGCESLLAICVAFPPEAHAISAMALHARLAGMAYTTRTPQGQRWEMRFGADGNMHMAVSDGRAGQGLWRAEDSRLFMDIEATYPSVSAEVRADAKRLYLQCRETGSVVTLEPLP